MSIFIPLAAAQDPLGTAAAVAGASGGSDASNIGDIVAAIGAAVAPLVNIIALLAVIIAGVSLTISQDEGQISKAWKTIFTAIAAVLLVNAAGAIQASFEGGNLTALGDVIAELASMLERPAAVLAVMFMIISGIKAVTSYKDDGLPAFRQSIFSILAGVVILSARPLLTGSVLGGSPEGVVATILGVINIIVGIIALVAVAVIIIAGFRMILNIGNDDQYTQARNLIIRVGIGLIVIIMALALANIVIFASPG